MCARHARDTLRRRASRGARAEAPGETAAAPVALPPAPPAVASRIVSRRQPVLAGAAASVLYLALALWVLCDLLPRWGTAYAGGGELEGWLWRYWWMKQLVVGAWHANPLYALYVALVSGSFPETGNVFDLQWFSWPLQTAVGAPQYYNLKVVLFLVLNGMAGYWLGRLLVADWTASVLGGIAFGFGSYVLLEIDGGRIRQAGVFPLALYALCLMRMQGRRGDWRAACWAGLAFGLCSSMYLYYGVCALFLTVLWLASLGMPEKDAPLQRRLGYVGILALAAALLYLAMRAGAPPAAVDGLFVAAMTGLLAWLHFRARWPGFRSLLLLGGIAVVTSAPYATWYLEQAVVHRQPLPEVTYNRNFPPLEFLLNPQNVHATDDNLLNSLQRFRSDSVSWDLAWMPAYRRSVPLVFTVLIALGLVASGRRPWLWVSTMLLGYVLSLGPYLRAGPSEEYVRTFLGHPMPPGIQLPQALFFKYVPFFSRLFSPIRMEALFLLGFGVLAAWSVARGFMALRVAAWARPWLLFPVAIPVLLQLRVSHVAPLSYTPVRIPAVYEWLARSSAPGIVELPFREGDYANYYQTIHQKRVLEGWATGSLPPGYPDNRTAWLAQSAGLVENPFVRALRRWNEGPDADASFDRGDVDPVVRQGYRYAFLHERGCYMIQGAGGRAQYLWMRAQMERHFGPPIQLAFETAHGLAGTAGPEADGRGNYEIAVYDLAAARRRPGGAGGVGTPQRLIRLKGRELPGRERLGRGTTRSAWIQGGKFFP